MEIHLTGEGVDHFYRRCYLLFRLSGKIGEEGDIFARVLERIDHNDPVDLNSWACSLWYVFSQIYSCEHELSESYQPPSDTPGALEISPISQTEFNGYFEPDTLSNLANAAHQKLKGTFWNFGKTLNGSRNISSIIEWVQRRESTGCYRTGGAFVSSLCSKRAPEKLRHVQFSALWPKSYNQWHFWRQALWFVCTVMWGIDLKTGHNVERYFRVPLQFRVRLDWVVKQCSACKNAAHAVHTTAKLKRKSMYDSVPKDAEP